MNSNLYQQENNELLKFILNERFFSLWSEEEYNKTQYNFSRSANLELYITNTCN